METIPDFVLIPVLCLAGPRLSPMPVPVVVRSLLLAERYSHTWPLLPREAGRDKRTFALELWSAPPRLEGPSLEAVSSS